MVGDALEAKKYSLQLFLTNGDKGLKSLFQCPVIAIDKRKDCHDSQILLPLTQLQQLGKWNNSGEYNLEWTINVQIVKKFGNENGPKDVTIVKVETCPYALRRIEKPNTSISPMSILRESKSGNVKVFLDLAYETELIGRLVIELRNDIVPFTAENFRCLCTGEKGLSYRGTCFYYIQLHNYIVGGDVTRNDGTGGKSIYGETFNNEKFVIKHSERGILSMQNGGKINANNSKFMILLKEQPDWDRTNVAFGKVIHGMKVLDDLEKLILFFDAKHEQEQGIKNRKIIIRNCGQLYNDEALNII